MSAAIKNVPWSFLGKPHLGGKKWKSIWDTPYEFIFFRGKASRNGMVESIMYRWPLAFGVNSPTKSMAVLSQRVTFPLWGENTEVPSGNL